MNILMITENDPAGMGIAFTRAVNRYSGHRCRLITTTTRYNFDFEKDIHVPDLDEDGFDEIVQLLREADIIHFHVLADEHLMLGPVRVKDYVAGKKIVHHHHGHPHFRAHPEEYKEKYRRLRRRVLVSTPDLLQLLPEAQWQPNMVPIDSPYYLPAKDGAGGKMRICQSPTRKDLKNSSEFESVVESLRKTCPHVEKVMVENSRHLDCLRIKQTCDIHFDHMQGYFGVSSLEGLSQGKVVVAGLDRWNIRCIREYFGCEHLPWIIARNGGELKEELTGLAKDRERTERLGRDSRKFMEEYWNPQAVVAGLTAVYGSL